jgi:hypothetical protein
MSAWWPGDQLPRPIRAATLGTNSTAIADTVRTAPTATAKPQLDERADARQDQRRERRGENDCEEVRASAAPRSRALMRML